MPTLQAQYGTTGYLRENHQNFPVQMRTGVTYKLLETNETDYKSLFQVVVLNRLQNHK